jgi:hypothetical protein
LGFRAPSTSHCPRSDHATLVLQLDLSSPGLVSDPRTGHSKGPCPRRASSSPHRSCSRTSGLQADVENVRCPASAWRPISACRLHTRPCTRAPAWLLGCLTVLCMLLNRLDRQCSMAWERAMQRTPAMQLMPHAPDRGRVMHCTPAMPPMHSSWLTLACPLYRLLVHADGRRSSWGRDLQQICNLAQHADNDNHCCPGLYPLGLSTGAASGVSLFRG